MSKKEMMDEDGLKNQDSKLDEINEGNCSDLNTDFVKKLQQDLEEEKEKTNEYLDHLKRTMADFDNYKKRINKEKELLYTNVLSDLVADLLPVLDNFEKAIQSEGKDKTEYETGIEMIYNQFRDILKKFNVEEIEGVGSQFNPEVHDAVMHTEDSNAKENEIVEVFRKGYKVGDKVIRHSMVKVAN